MDEFELMRIVLDAIVVICVVLLFFGLKNSRIFIGGRFYYYSENKFQYWQAVIGYLLMIFGTAFLRIHFLS